MAKVKTSSEFKEALGQIIEASETISFFDAFGVEFDDEEESESNEDSDK